MNIEVFQLVPGFIVDQFDPGFQWINILIAHRIGGYQADRFTVHQDVEGGQVRWLLVNKRLVGIGVLADILKRFNHHGQHLLIDSEPDIVLLRHKFEFRQ